MACGWRGVGEHRCSEGGRAGGDGGSPKAARGHATRRRPLEAHLAQPTLLHHLQALLQVGLGHAALTVREASPLQLSAASMSSGSVLRCERDQQRTNVLRSALSASRAAALQSSNRAPVAPDVSGHPASPTSHRHSIPTCLCRAAAPAAQPLAAPTGLCAQNRSLREVCKRSHLAPSRQDQPTTRPDSLARLRYGSRRQSDLRHHPSGRHTSCRQRAGLRLGPAQVRGRASAAAFRCRPPCPPARVSPATTAGPHLRCAA